MLRAEEELDIQYEFTEQIAATDFEKVVREYAERFGVFEAAREADVFAFGNMSDQNELAPDTVITGPVWNMYPTVEYLINQVRAGAYVAQDLKDWSTMAIGGASLAPLHGFSETLPAEVIAEVEALEAEILAGPFGFRLSKKSRSRTDGPRGRETTPLS